MDCPPNNSRSDRYLCGVIYSFLQTERIQTNDYDCGLWVLASVAAVLRGHDATGLTESNMLAFRYYLRSCVLSIPVA